MNYLCLWKDTDSGEKGVIPVNASSKTEVFSEFLNKRSSVTANLSVNIIAVDPSELANPKDFFKEWKNEQEKQSDLQALVEQLQEVSQKHNIQLPQNLLDALSPAGANQTPATPATPATPTTPTTTKKTPVKKAATPKRRAAKKTTKKALVKKATAKTPTKAKKVAPKRAKKKAPARRSRRVVSKA